MPLYVYECSECKERFEELQKNQAEGRPEICPICCNTDLELVPAASNFHLKGSGWYKGEPVEGE